jgi:hypothetical protein
MIITERQGTADRREVDKFDALAARWWDKTGPMRPLHAMNPARTAWIMQRIRARFGNDPVDLLDVGCGAGLLAESLTLTPSGHVDIGVPWPARESVMIGTSGMASRTSSSTDSLGSSGLGDLPINGPRTTPLIPDRYPA